MYIRADVLWAGCCAVVVLLNSVVNQEGEGFGCGGGV